MNLIFFGVSSAILNIGNAEMKRTGMASKRLVQDISPKSRTDCQ